MCGACRLTVGNEVKFACVDGPEFDGHLVDFDEATICGANGVEVDFDGEKYLLFGEYTIITGERFVYVIKK